MWTSARKGAGNACSQGLTLILEVAQREADRVNVVVPGAEAHVIDVQLLRSGT